MPQSSFNFEKLEVWQKSIVFAERVYRATRTFPEDERFGLISQLRGAATSISANIAEGSARSSADFSRFIGYATGSLYEVLSEITISRNQGFITAENYRLFYVEAEEIARMLSGLRRALGP